MKTKATIAAFILLLSPAAAFAYGCNGAAHDATQQASMSCAEGMTYDADQNTCVADVTG
jgi:hypothetical protein